MNPDIHKLYKIAQKDERLIVGLMSGTSLDGLDVTLCKIKGSGIETKVQVLHFETEPYSDETKTEIRKIFAKENIQFQDLCLLNEWIGNLHAEIILKFLKKWKVANIGVDLIGSHGQTVFHSPFHQHQQQKFGNATLQIGDGDQIAYKTKIITVSDFRQKHIAGGGEGAPLAVYGDYFIFSSPDEDRIMLNMGGIANFTFLPKSQNVEEIFSTDTGPANTLIDAFVRLYFGLSFDENGNIAQNGKVNNDLLKELKQHQFFNSNLPKTTGPEIFNMDFVKNAINEIKIENIAPEDLITTLTQLSAETITECIKKAFPDVSQFKIYMSGGGVNNNFLIDQMKKLLPQADFIKIDELGIKSDAKEAVLFAVLANECVAGKKLYFQNSKSIPNIRMGKISFPE